MVARGPTSFGATPTRRTDGNRLNPKVNAPRLGLLILRSFAEISLLSSVAVIRIMKSLMTCGYSTSKLISGQRWLSQTQPVCHPFPGQDILPACTRT